MAKSIKSLAIGSKVIDENGNKFIIIANNHYVGNSVLLWSEQKYKSSPINKNSIGGASTVDYANSDVQYDLNNEYPKTLGKINDFVLNVKVDYEDYTSQYQSSQKSFYSKYFLLGFDEFDGGIPYFNSNNRRSKDEIYWTRSERTPSSSSSWASFLTVQEDGSLKRDIYPDCSLSYGIYPAFNVSSDLLVSDTVSNGYYTIIFNNPPVINTIGNIKGSYGSDTKITYTAIDSDDTILNHYISFDNGGSWGKINPSKVNNTYIYTHVFNELKNYACRIKVVDSAGNEAVSNMFIVEVSLSAPTVNIVSVKDKVITFKANCITDEVSKVEILINSVVKKTFNSGFDFNLTYEINNSDLVVGDNSVQIKATSTANLTGVKDLEVNKKSYNLPPIGTKVVINNIEYTITNATLEGSNHTYTLDKNLINSVKANDIVKVMQDKVNVKCSLSNVSANKEFKDMKLVKSKILKGDFEGYIEEKYELNGEGRYSTIKLELERFNSSAENEIIELQQAFDYMED